jgi:hypothetical protein
MFWWNKIPSSDYPTRAVAQWSDTVFGWYWGCQWEEWTFLSGRVLDERAVTTFHGLPGSMLTRDSVMSKFKRRHLNWLWVSNLTKFRVNVVVLLSCEPKNTSDSIPYIIRSSDSSARHLQQKLAHSFQHPKKCSTTRLETFINFINGFRRWKRTNPCWFRWNLRQWENTVHDVHRNELVQLGILKQK